MGTTIVYVYVECSGYVIPVTIEYIVDIDQNYGADADGNRGVKLVSREILDASICSEDLKQLTVGDAEYILEEARNIFSNRIR